MLVFVLAMILHKVSVVLQEHRAIALQLLTTGRMVTYLVRLLCSLLPVARLSRTWHVPTAQLPSSRLATVYQTSKPMQHVVLQY